DRSTRQGRIRRRHRRQARLEPRGRQNREEFRARRSRRVARRKASDGCERRPLRLKRQVLTRSVSATQSQLRLCWAGGYGGTVGCPRSEAGRIWFCFGEPDGSPVCPFPNPGPCASWGGETLVAASP